MKKAALLLAFAAAGCGDSRPPGVDHRTLLMETMVARHQPGSYTFMRHPNVESSANYNGSNLIIKMKQSTKTVEGKPSLCANFRTLIVMMTNNGDYMLPYVRYTIAAEDKPTAEEESKTLLKDFKPETLLNIPETIPVKGSPKYPYHLHFADREICQPLPEV